ncbi:MAG: glycosyltransferase family 4 protein [Candidatus Sumerlaeia bacterium]|nr:glycosyltransferase family 4 protein [Candidatus Sumerlaeia bacterium]
MRFLFINQYYSPDYAATAQQLSDVCEQLVQDNHEVHVLTSRAIYDGRDLVLPTYEVLNGVHVHRLSIGNTGRKRLRDRFMGYASFYAKAFAKIHTLPRPDVVVTLTTPPLISMLGAYLRVLKGSRFVYWVMDVYPDIAIKAGVLPQWFPANFLAKTWSAFGWLSYTLANKIVVLGEDMKSAIASKGISEEKLSVIQSWACRHEVFPIDASKNHFRNTELDANSYNVMYSGNMGTCHRFQEVIAAAKELSPEEGIRFSFVGGGKQQPLIKSALESLSHVRFLPYQDRSELSQSLSAPDLHLITLDPRYDGLLVPSKLYAVMAAGKPILFVGSRKNEIARIITEAECGVIVEPGDAAGFASAVRRLAANPSTGLAMGANGLRYFLANFDKQILVSRLGNLLQTEALTPGLRGARSLSHSTVNLRESRTFQQLRDAVPLKHDGPRKT